MGWHQGDVDELRSHSGITIDAGNGENRRLYNPYCLVHLEKSTRIKTDFIP